MVKNEGKEIPHIIGLELQDIAKITINKIREKIKEKTDHIHFIVYRDSFVPPEDSLVNQIAESIMSKEVSINFGGVFSIIKTSPETEGGGKDYEQFRYDAVIEPSDFCFRIKDGVDFSKALKMVQSLKNRDVSKVAFIYSPDDTYISLDSEVEDGSLIYPYTFIVSSKIGRSVKIYQGNTILMSKIGDNVEVLPYCYIEGADIESEVKVGPFSRMRPHVKLKSRTRIGNFTEIKNSEIGEDSRIQHFSYIGDAVIGKNVNIGAGTVTCNFDGRKKNRTYIGDGVFVGSGSMLVAPVRLENYSYIGAGSTITKDVPSYSLAVERADMKIIANWVKRKFMENKSDQQEENK